MIILRCEEAKEGEGGGYILRYEGEEEEGFKEKN